MSVELFKNWIKPKLTEFLRIFLNVHIGGRERQIRVRQGERTEPETYCTGFGDGFNAAIDMIEAELSLVDRVLEKKIAVLK